MEDGWVAADNPNSTKDATSKKADAMDIDDIENIDDVAVGDSQQEAVDIDDIDN